MDFSLTSFFVVPNGTLASSGSTQDLTPGQLGVFRPDYSLAIAGNIAAAKYFRIHQGRPAGSRESSKATDKIHASKVIEWYKVLPEDTSADQILTLNAFQFKCDQDVTVSVRIFGRFPESAHYNGLTEGVVVKGPCCDCGELPCTTVDAAEVESVVREIAFQLSKRENIAAYLTVNVTGTGANTAVVLTAKPASTITNNFGLDTQTVSYDRITFRTYAYVGTPTFNDDLFVFDACEGVTAVATVNQRATFKHGSSAEMKMLERNYYSYQTSAFKSLYNNQGWNGNFESQIVDGTYYDLYYIKAGVLDAQYTWNDFTTQDFAVLLAFPTGGTASAFETVMTAALGAPKNYSGLDVTTTTSTTTSTTTTTQPLVSFL